MLRAYSLKPLGERRTYFLLVKLQWVIMRHLLRCVFLATINPLRTLPYLRLASVFSLLCSAIFRSYTFGSGCSSSSSFIISKPLCRCPFFFSLSLPVLFFSFLFLFPLPIDFWIKCNLPKTASAVTRGLRYMLAQATRILRTIVQDDKSCLLPERPSLSSPRLILSLLVLAAAGL